MKTKHFVGLIASAPLWIACGGNVLGANADGGSISANTPADAAADANPTARAASHCATMSDKAKQCQSRDYNADECSNDATCSLQIFEPAVAESVLKCSEAGLCETSISDCIQDIGQRTTISASAKALQASCGEWSSQCRQRTNCDLSFYVAMSDALLAQFSKCFVSGSCGTRPSDCMNKAIAAVSPACALAISGNGNNGNNGGGQGGSGGGQGGGGNVPTADAGPPMPTDAGPKSQ